MPGTNCVWTRLDQCLNTSRSHELDSFLYGALWAVWHVRYASVCSDVVTIPIAWSKATRCSAADHPSSRSRAGSFGDWRLVQWHHGASFLMFAMCTFLMFCTSNLALRNFSASKGEAMAEYLRNL